MLVTVAATDCDGAARESSQVLKTQPLNPASTTLHLLQKRDITLQLLVDVNQASVCFQPQECNPSRSAHFYSDPRHAIPLFGN